MEGHCLDVRVFLRIVNKSLEDISSRDVEDFLLERYSDKSLSRYRNVLGSLRIFFRDFLKRPDIIADFKFPKIPIKLRTNLPSKSALNQFYDALPDIRDKTIFLMYASSGLRCSEVLGLSFEDVDFSKRMIMPNGHTGSTKHSYISFYNDECAKVLDEYLDSRRDGLIFQVSRRRIESIFRNTSEYTGIRITPQTLREWFCSEMGRLGVPDRYVDAFCGRVPKSVLGKHYTDYSPEALKKIYDKASLHVL